MKVVAPIQPNSHLQEPQFSFAFSNSQIIVDSLFDKVYPLKNQAYDKAILIYDNWRSSLPTALAGIKFSIKNNTLKIIQIAFDFSCDESERSQLIDLVILVLIKLKLIYKITNIIFTGSKAFIYKLTCVYEIVVKNILNNRYKLDFGRELLWQVKYSLKQQNISYCDLIKK